MRFCHLRPSLPPPLPPSLPPSLPPYQDVCCALGSPDKTFFKAEDKVTSSLVLYTWKLKSTFRPISSNLSLHVRYDTLNHSISWNRRGISLTHSLTVYVFGTWCWPLVHSCRCASTLPPRTTYPRLAAPTTSLTTLRSAWMCCLMPPPAASRSLSCTPMSQDTTTSTCELVYVCVWGGGSYE